MSVLHTVMAATLALSGTLPGLPSHRKRPANRRPDGSWIMGARERSRLAWRQRVDAAARAYSTVCNVAPGGDHYIGFMRRLLRHLGKRNPYRRPARLERGMFPRFRRPEADALTAALAAPRPWRSPRKPDPRNHYPLSHRRACWRCRIAGYGLRRGQVSGYALKFITLDDYLCVDLRDPHGRSDR